MAAVNRRRFLRIGAASAAASLCSSRSHGIDSDPPVHRTSSPLKAVDGVVRCPDGPGFGVEIDPDYVAKAKSVRPE